MRTPLFAMIGVVWLAGSGASVAAPINAAAIGEAAEQMSLAESVHCRPFRHWHRWGYSRDCGRVYIDEGVRIRSRIGVRDRFGVRSRIGVRDGFRGESRSGVTVRSEGGSVRSGTSFRNTPGETSTRQTGGRAGTGGAQGGMSTAPTGGGTGAAPSGTAGAPATKQ
jgi:hypothetical protein